MDSFQPLSPAVRKEDKPNLPAVNSPSCSGGGSLVCRTGKILGMRRAPLALILCLLAAVCAVVFVYREMNRLKLPPTILRSADHADDVALADAQRQIVEFFSRLKTKRVGQFADDATDMHAQFDVVWDKLPFSSRQHLKSLLAEDFRDDVLTQQQMQDELRNVTAVFADREAAANNRLRVAVASYLVAHAAEAHVHTDAESKLLVRKLWRQSIKRIEASGQRNAGSAVENNIAGTIAAGIVATLTARVATNLGADAAVDGGAVEVGADTAPETAGISLVAAGVAAVGFNAIYNFFSDPSAPARKSADEALDKMQFSTLHGDGKDPGLLGILKSVVAQQRKMRRNFLRAVESQH